MFSNHSQKRPLRTVAIMALFAIVVTNLPITVHAATYSWTKLNTAQSLPSRAGFATAYDPISKKVVVFGGYNATNQLNETWTFDGTTWTQVQTATAPPPRSSAAMAYDSRIQIPPTDT